MGQRWHPDAVNWGSEKFIWLWIFSGSAVWSQAKPITFLGLSFHIWNMEGVGLDQWFLNLHAQCSLFITNILLHPLYFDDVKFLDKL